MAVSLAWRRITRIGNRPARAIPGLPGTALRSRVAQRLLLLFLFAAMLPATGLGLLVYHQASDTLLALNYRSLEAHAKGLGMSLVQRLVWRAETLHLQLAAQTDEASQKPDDRNPLLRKDSTIESLAVVEPETLLKLRPEELEHLKKSGVLLQLTPAGNALMTIADARSADHLQVMVAGERLWQHDNENETYCVLTLAGQPLHCSPGLPVPPPARWSVDERQARHAGVFAWEVNGEEQLAAFWHVPLTATFAHEGLIVVVSDSRANALAALTQFRMLFPAVAVLAMAMAVWLALIQIRRQMRPLEDLTRHTENLAQGNFANRVEVSGNDEFSRLAEAFNSMSDHLNHKFHLLQALAELDRAILNVSEMESVIRLLLQRTPQCLPCDLAGVLRFDAAGDLLVWAIDAGETSLEQTRRVGGDHALCRRLEGEETALLLDLRQPDTQDLAFFADRGATQAVLFPAHLKERCDSVLVLAYRRPLSDTDEVCQAGRSLADRLASAAVSIAWGNELYRQAHFDALTGLPNRTLLRDRVHQSLLRAQRGKLAVALLLIDLDNFKDVNDSLGHSAGDALLVSCAEKLAKVARHTDTVARLGGDEFVVVLVDLPTPDTATIVDRMATTLNTELARPVELHARTVSIAASIGIAIYPDNGADMEELMKNADAAMYQSKRAGQGGYRFYSEQLNAAAKARFEMLQDLRKAFDDDEFFLVYQPKIEATSGRVVGAEALIRWASPRLGLVSPARFIPLIDEVGLDAVLGQWVIETACAQMAAWDADGVPPICVSVNASPAQFRSNAIISQLRSALTRNGLQTDRLELEILESTAIGKAGDVNETLAELRAMNVSIALDDFGTGYSSLVYLTNLPANVLKIDRGFITDLLTDQRKRTIVGQIISLAKALGFKVVAEGVEESEQARVLGAMGCDLFQGYLFSKPLLPAAFVAFQEERGSRLV
jgi:diguanylate cyclase (GGDEF)-like protein